MKCNSIVAPGELRNDQAAMMSDISDEEIMQWSMPQNLYDRKVRYFAGFEIVDSLDGTMRSDREVALVRLVSSEVYRQHIHCYSDGLFIAVSGKALLLTGDLELVLVPGSRVWIPRGVPHGFKIIGPPPFTFISVQRPPIRDRATGAEDIEFVQGR